MWGQEAEWWVLEAVLCSVAPAVSDSVTPWTVTCQATLSMGVSRCEYGSGWACPPPGDPPNPGTESTFLMPPALAGRVFTTVGTWEALLEAKRGEWEVSVQWV